MDLHTDIPQPDFKDVRMSWLARSFILLLITSAVREAIKNAVLLLSLR
jgi:hypothetical protein